MRYEIPILECVRINAWRSLETICEVEIKETEVTSDL